EGIVERVVVGGDAKGENAVAEIRERLDRVLKTPAERGAGTSIESAEADHNAKIRVAGRKTGAAFRLSGEGCRCHSEARGRKGQRGAMRSWRTSRVQSPAR